MEFHTPDITTPQSSPSQSHPPARRFSLKERYSAEAEALRKKLGPLEQIRRDLSLSQRKMSELLLVDPSSWNRWVRRDQAPPYIYKSLQWFLALKERNPELASFAWIKAQSTERQNIHMETELSSLKAEVRRMSLELSAYERPSAEASVLPGRLGVASLFIALGVAMGWSLSQWL